MKKAMRVIIVVVIGLVTMMRMPSPVASASVYSRTPSYCLQPPPRSEGYCTIDIEGFYFDPRTNNCEQYQVGGCRSIPGQSFGSRDDCLATCVYMTRHIEDLYIE